MAQLIRMPKLSDTMEEGGIARWLKKEGDRVALGEPLLEIETDKATMEYASPEDGVLLKILAQAGSTNALQAPIAILGEPGEAFDQLLAEPTPAQPAQTHSAPEPKKEATILPTVERIKASPLAKKIAKEKNLDLAGIQGSGPGGRIVSRDLAASPVSQALSHSSPYRDEPLSMMRKTIAKRLTQAKVEAPHFYLTTTLDGGGLLSWKNRLTQKSGIKISINDLLLFACAKALARHPQVNSSWQGDSVRYHSEVHLAMAVALPTGLITPVLFQADRMGILELAQKTKELGKNAKEGKLAPTDYQGGTFTVSNLGMTVVDSFTAIINPPQAAILAVGRMKKVPAVDPTGEKLIIQDQMTLTLSCDHRVVDGMVGAQFLDTLKRFIEDPLSMME
jgi:pyruvate dehydrogenase E2 component (dihydrolipoamide acetyltransferase)